jgi:hypothetical protein
LIRELSARQDSGAVPARRKLTEFPGAARPADCSDAHFAPSQQIEGRVFLWSLDPGLRFFG